MPTTTISVTGASGHIGCNIVRTLLNQGYRVRALSYRDRRALEGLPIKIVQGDINDPAALDELLRGAHCLVHCAGHIAVDNRETEQLHKTNVLGTQMVIDAVLRNQVKRLVHFSSIHALVQEPMHLPVDETRALHFDSPFAYDRSKAQGEQLVLDAVAQRGLDAVIINPTSVLGGNDFKPSLQGQALLDFKMKRIPALTKGGFNWVDVLDVAEAGVAAIEKGRKGERYIVGGQWHSMKEIALMVENITGVRAPRWMVPLWLAKASIPLANFFSKLKGQKPLLTKEALEIMLSGNINIIGEKTRMELGVEPRPVEGAVRAFLRQGI